MVHGATSKTTGRIVLDVPVRLRPLTNRSEAVVSEQLHVGLGESEWRVVPQVAIREVIRPIDDKLTPPELRLLEYGHFDFAVYASRRFDTPPAFVVEFDGPYHAANDVVDRDIAKNRLCDRAALPLLRLSQEDLTPLEQRTVIAWIAERFVARQREMPNLEVWAQSELERLAAEGADMDEVVESLNYDTSVIFDLDHPFPENMEIAHRLLDRYALRTLYVPGPADDHSLCLDDGGWSSGSENGLVSEFAVCERRCEIRRGGEVLHAFVAKSRMAWGHKIRHSGPAGGEPPRTADLWAGEYMDWVIRRVEDLSSRYVPGADPHDITEAISQYNAMRYAERWIGGAYRSS
ncbi:MAG: DUF2726 domain-containing protein [Chloroflexota bacterium]